MSNNKFKLYGLAGSTCTQVVITTAIESGAEFDLHRVDLQKGEHKQPEHLARQPFGKIPAIEDDGFQLYESRAIARYLNETRGGSKLVPSDPRERALMEQWISLEQGTISPEFWPILRPRVFGPLFGAPPADEEEMAKAADKLRPSLDVMERHLSSHAYLAGSQFSLADLFFLPYFGHLFRTPERKLVHERPHLLDWWRRISSRPAWVKAQSLSEFADKLPPVQE